MDVALGMHLVTRDGKDAGTVERLILDPAAGAVKTIVVRKGAILPHEVELPAGALEVDSDSNVQLSYTAQQLDALPPFEGDTYSHRADTEQVSSTKHEAEEHASVQPWEVQRAAIGEGSAVISRDGKQVGVVQRLTYDPASGGLRHCVVRKGMLLTEDVEIPASLVAKVAAGVLQLGVDADDLHTM